MKENDVHKCLLSYGFYPMTLVLKELEGREEFEKCKNILDAMNSYKERFNVQYDTYCSDNLKKNILATFKKKILKS